ncbi:MAG: hypothetical protein ACKVZJ_13045 [Phycisphaerales bacterium]
MTQRFAPSALGTASVTRWSRAAVLSVLAAAGAAGSFERVASAQVSTVILQWFETPWSSIEYRMPDFFIAGYTGTWLPPPSRAADPTSPGYDVFERFDLGSPSNRTAYGTSEQFRAMVGAFKRASGQVYVDAVLNHNSGRNGSLSFYNEGGYPGFWLGPGPAPLNNGSNWGDFNNGATQSENPGGANYNLWNGDLVALVDINQGSNNQYIRHPASVTPPPGGVNIPPGSVRNLPNPNNTALYPDTALAAQNVANPGQNRGACCGFPASSVAAQNFSFAPFNSATPSAGDPVMENATGLLMRWTQWMLDIHQVDGFRWDASKHIPPFFWDQYIDSVLFQRRTAPDGSKVTPFNFGENVMANDQIWNFYIRKGNLRTGYSFGNRDALDLAGSGALRDMVNQRGFFSWGNVLNAHLDNADDFDNNGSLGVNHVWSHDNGSNGNGSAFPGLPAADKAAWPEFAYLLMRTGLPKIYHHGRGLTRTSGFFPREGSPEALGLDRDLDGTNTTLTRLVQLHNRYARGAWDVKVLEADVICFERHAGGLTNVICGANDSYSNGFDQRTFVTRYPAGTRLVELSGNATDPQVDPNNDIFDTVTVAAGGNVTIRVPRNRSATGFEHNKGYVIYGQVTPPGTYSISSGLTSTVGPDTIAVPPSRRRINPVNVVSGNSFSVQLQTQNDPTEGALDDNAIYRFNQGFYGSNVGTNGTSAGEPVGEFTGYENFVTSRSPRIGGGTGLYQQVINTSNLPEGMNFLSVISFRQRTGGTSPIYSEWRDAIWIDRVDPVVNVDPFSADCAFGDATVTIRNPDLTAANVYVFLDLPVGSPLPALTPANQAFNLDRGVFSYTLTSVPNGNHTVTLVAQELVGTTLVRQTRYAPINFVSNRLLGDYDLDGSVNTGDLTTLLGAFGTSVPPGSAPDLNNDGLVNTQDLTTFLGAFGQSCL